MFDFNHTGQSTHLGLTCHNKFTLLVNPDKVNHVHFHSTYTSFKPIRETRKLFFSELSIFFFSPRDTKNAVLDLIVNLYNSDNII